MKLCDFCYCFRCRFRRCLRGLSTQTCKIALHLLLHDRRKLLQLLPLRHALALQLRNHLILLSVVRLLMRNLLQEQWPLLCVRLEPLILLPLILLQLPQLVLELSLQLRLLLRMLLQREECLK